MRSQLTAGEETTSPRPWPRSSQETMPQTARLQGFTLIEILVVIVVIAVLATLVAPNVFRHVAEAKDVTARSQIEMLGAALDAYRLDNGPYPPTPQGLAALGRGRGPTVYPSRGQRSAAGYDLVSYGADGQPRGDGEAADILSWK